MATARRKPPMREVHVPGQLGAMLRRRIGAPATPSQTKGKPAKKSAGKVLTIPESETGFLSDILRRTRNAIRAPRQATYVHVSDLISRCIRKKAIVELHKVAMPVNRLSLMDALTYRQGDAIHDVVKERAVSSAPESVWGKWRCKCGTLRVKEPCIYEAVDTKVLCDNCGECATLYDEAEFIDPELDIVGHPDLLFYLAALGAYYVTELKSISHDRYKELVRPDPEHVIQSLFYWYLMKRNGYTVVDRVSILYVTKGYLFKGVPYKEFTFTPTDELRRLDVYLADARAMKEARSSGVLPTRTFCAASTSPVARACEVCNICFEEPNASAPVVVSFSQATARTAKKANK